MTQSPPRKGKTEINTHTKKKAMQTHPHDFKQLPEESEAQKFC